MKKFLSSLLALSLWCSVAVGQPTVELGDFPGELDPGRPTTAFTVRFVMVDTRNENVLVVYDWQRSDGESRENVIARFFLNNDRFINYKISMLTLLRDSISNENVRVWITLAPSTEGTTNQIISAVTAGRS